MGCTYFGNINVEVFGTNEITVHVIGSKRRIDQTALAQFNIPLEGTQCVYLEGSLLQQIGKADHYVPLVGEIGNCVELEGCVYLTPLS